MLLRKQVARFFLDCRKNQRIVHWICGLEIMRNIRGGVASETDY